MYTKSSNNPSPLSYNTNFSFTPNQIAVMLAYYLEFLICIALVLLILLNRTTWFGKKRNKAPTNWPILGMLPGVLPHVHRIHDYITEVQKDVGTTFEFKGPWFCGMDMVVTSDPINVHHVFSKKFANYEKGPEYKKIFDILGDGIFNADFQLWTVHRRTTLEFLTRAGFSRLIESSVWEKVQKGLFPLLDSFVEKGVIFDLQDIFQRFTFDNICKLTLNYDPCCLSLGLPENKCEKAFNVVIEVLLHRHILPPPLWKTMRWLQIGKERGFTAAWKAFDEFIYRRVGDDYVESDGSDLLKTFAAAYKENGVGSAPELRSFLRDTALNLMLAGRDTSSTCLTWLFYLLAKNPSAQTKIIEELERELGIGATKWRFFTVEESRRLVYLQGALSESLRLYPPVALEHKAPVEEDILPSGVELKKNTKVIFSFYSMGRMESIWGEDWSEFKPERWISASGTLKHHPSYKFPAFNAGPRTCLGKDMAFILMKMVAASIVFHYNFKLDENNVVSPRDSIILQARDGLLVKLTRASV